jgi:hypothetical protein
LGRLEPLQKYQQIICSFGSKVQHTPTRELDEVDLLALLRPVDVRWDEGVHERLEVWPPPLRQRIANHPLIVDALACELCADWCEALVQPRLEAFDLVVFRTEVVAWPLGR